MGREGWEEKGRKEGERERKVGEEVRREGERSDHSNSDTGMSANAHTNLAIKTKYTVTHLNCLPLRV